MVKSQECSSQLKHTKKYQKQIETNAEQSQTYYQKKIIPLRGSQQTSFKVLYSQNNSKSIRTGRSYWKERNQEKKLKVESIVRVSVLNPLTLQVQPLCVQSETTQVLYLSKAQIYVDKQPTHEDQLNIANEQKQLISSQYQKLTQALTQEIKNTNLASQSLIQNMLLSSQIVFKQILDFKPQIQAQKEFDSVSTSPYPFQQIQSYPYFYPLPHSFLRI